MLEGKYFDWDRGKMLSEADGCQLESWRDDSQYSFALHPAGFSLFLRPGQLKGQDEYADGDPYLDSNTIEPYKTLDTAFHRGRLTTTINLIRSELANDISCPRILDVGCGVGHITANVLRAFPNAEVSGVDYSLMAIARACEFYPEIDFAVADANILPFAAAYFDVVVCNNTWEHVPNPLRMLGAIQKVLKRGGLLVVSTPSRYRLWNLVRVVIGRPVELMSPNHVTEYSVGQIIEQLRFGGFTVRRIEDGPVRTTRRRGKSALLANKVVLPLASFWLKLIRSHHSMASTVFFLAVHNG